MDVFHFGIRRKLLEITTFGLTPSLRWNLSILPTNIMSNSHKWGMGNDGYNTLIDRILDHIKKTSPALCGICSQRHLKTWCEKNDPFPLSGAFISSLPSSTKRSRFTELLSWGAACRNSRMMQGFCVSKGVATPSAIFIVLAFNMHVLSLPCTSS